MASCGGDLARIAALATAQQVQALAAFRAEGVVLHAWPDDIFLSLRIVWEDVIAKETAWDPLLV